MSGLVISYSGIRGVIGRDLDRSVARRFGTAFRRMVTEAHPVGPLTLVVGRDTRASGPELQHALIEGLSDARVRIIDLDVAPTPTIQFALGAFAAEGAVAVTASHNPAQWNGFKFFLAPDRTVLDGAQTERLILSLPASAPDVPSASPIDNRQEQAAALHVARVLEQVNAESIRRRRFRVALDAARGAGSVPRPACWRRWVARSRAWTSSANRSPFPSTSRRSVTPSSTAAARSGLRKTSTGTGWR